MSCPSIGENDRLGSWRGRAAKFGGLSADLLLDSMQRTDAGLDFSGSGRGMHRTEVVQLGQ